MSEIADIPQITTVTPERPVKDQDTARAFPEIIGNTPLENTTFVYSIPAMGEWKNGNLKRQIHAFLSQRVDNPFEIEFLTNIGGKIESLLLPDEETIFKRNQHGEYILADRDLTETQIQTRKLLDEVDEANNFIKSLIEIQRISRERVMQPDNQELSEQLEQILNSFTDPLDNNILLKTPFYLTFQLIQPVHYLIYQYS
jgi:hypothetical protein